ncbi:hypothetical protein [Xenorhabdus innexi]|uniref:Uncharacterized protein n=1 Tax=Xenorhabdus innexi TaxID=290109 RepID=A0A1N6MWI9_9GAMM|nr:hypothetical protein [Xenorhabdus innexi]PHM35902.1 hypothetical protein Xinn_01972 [Xenorhabdus innexi]SIP73200.1 hypothetical protein XIS1_1790006 [Xenorhabdus innexi]
MNDEFFELLGFLVMGLALLGWLTSIISDAYHKLIWWVIVDITTFPLGVLRGFGVWFGFI